MSKKHKTPHDSLFKATLSIKSEAILFFKEFLPEDISEFLDFSTLTLKNTSYVGGKLKNYFSDMIYSCEWVENDRKVLLTFLLEHKSYPEKYPELQLLRYLLEGYEHQWKQEEELSLIVPVVLYHGKAKFNAKPFFEYFKLPHPRFGMFFPNFKFIMADLHKYADEQILAIGMSFLTSSLLLFKHKQERDYVLKNYKQIFIFVENYKSRKETERFLETLIRYIFQSFEIKEEEIYEIAEDLPKNASDMFISTYDQAVESGKINGVKIGEQIGIKKGEQIGIKKGEQIGIKKAAVFNSFESALDLFANTPDLDEKLMAKISKMKLMLLKSLRKNYESKDSKPIQNALLKSLKKIAPIHIEDKKRTIKILEKHFKSLD